MTIFIDPTEAREGTRLPHNVVEIAKALPGLEEKTGADLLISPLTVPAVSDDLLRKHTEAGILVQRKTGGDLTSSILDGRLTQSLSRMVGWSSRPWLLVVGTITEQRGLAVVDGRPTIDYGALQGALDWWQLRGGYLTLLSDDSKVAWWVGKQLDRVREIVKTPEIVAPRPAEQELSTCPIVNVLTLIPGVGVTRAVELRDTMQYYQANEPGWEGLRVTLLQALVWLTEPNTPKVNGIAEGTRAKVRQWLGLDDWERLAIEYRGNEE